MAAEKPGQPVEPGVKPRLRGVSHFIAFFVAVAAGASLAALTPRAGEVALGAAVYAVCLALVFGVSGFYHRPTWTARVRRLFKKVDHATIFLQIAGSYTAFWTITPPALRSTTLLAVMWGCALAGAATFVIWTELHRAIRAATFVAVGLSCAPLVLTLPQVLGWRLTVVVLAGAATYIAGALVYARRWPNPNPRVFGYHEVFHLMVIAAASMHFWVIVQAHFASG